MKRGAASAAGAAEIRQREIRLIHVGCSQLGMDDDTRRLMYRELTGCDSSKDMDAVERERVIAHLKSRGFRVTTPRAAGRAAGAPSRPLDTTAQATKVRALWLALHELGAVRDASEPALAAYVARMTHVDDLHWTSSADLHKLIESLKRWVQRVCRAMAPGLLRQVEAAGGIDAAELARLREVTAALTGKLVSCDEAQALVASLRGHIAVAAAASGAAA